MIMTVKQGKLGPAVLLRSHPRVFLPRQERGSGKCKGKAKKRGALTIVEVMVATVVLTITIVGALSYKYHAARDTQIARAQIAATRTAQLLLEDWMSTGGSKEYDPSILGLGFSSPLQVPSHFSQGQGEGLGNPLHDSVHAITVDGLPMMVMLTWKDIAHDSIADIKLRQLGVIVDFGVPLKEEETEATKRLEYIEPVIMTTYVRVDAASG